jgi:hypothetical protein
MGETCSKAFTQFNEFMAHPRMNRPDSALFLERYRGWLAPLANSKHLRIIDGAETVLQSGGACLIESGEFLTAAPFLPSLGAT